ENVTFTGAVPTVWVAVAECLEKNPERWKLPRGMRIAIAGSAAPESLVRKFDQFGAQMFQLWGLTETTPAATVSRLKRGMESLPEDEKYAIRTRQGLPLPFVEMRARSEGKRASGDGEGRGGKEFGGPGGGGGYFKLQTPLEK